MHWAVYYPSLNFREQVWTRGTGDIHIHVVQKMQVEPRQSPLELLESKSWT